MGPTTPLVYHLVRDNEDAMGAAATAPTDDLRRGGAAADVGLLSVCPECDRAFRSARGLSQHRCRAHPTEYHAENVPAARVKARWDHEKLLIMARAEITLRVSGVRNINQRLVQITPGRTLEATKGVRKSTRYHELLASLQPEAQSSELIERETVGPDQGSPNDTLDDTTPDPSPNQWAVEVRATIEQLGVPNGINIDAITPGLPNNHTREMLDAEYARWLPPLAGPNRRPPGSTGAPRVRTGQPESSVRARRRTSYARTQRSFKLSRRRCAHNVLSGTWEEQPFPVPMATQEPYWRGVFQHASEHDNREPPPKGPVEWDLVNPITITEVTTAIKGMSDGAPWPDRRSLSDFKRVRREEVAAHFNVWLLAGYPPAPLRRGETVLIAKEQGATSPEKHRPITLSDTILRCFHKILASWFEVTLPWNKHQKAFMRPLTVSVTRVFCSRLGGWECHLQCWATWVNSTETTGHAFALALTAASLSKCRGGVRQSDPLSVHLFNATIDWALDRLNPELGVMVGEVRVNAGAFPDDIALIARTPRGLQHLVEDLAAEFRLSGLEVSAGLDGKSASLQIDVDGKRKMWIVNLPHLQVFGQPIPAIGVAEVQRYLGVPLVPMRTRADIAGKLNGGLGNISRAPLKPQQRLYILNTNLIPALYHQLVLNSTTKKYLSGGLGGCTILVEVAA